MMRIVQKDPAAQSYQVAFLALNKQGEVGAFSLLPDFNFAVHDTAGNLLVPAESWFDQTAQ